jgi:very-short-patch-repair endonuclease
MSTLNERVLEALRDKPNQKADALAKSLGAERSQINKLLYGPLRGQVVQNSTYQWSLRSSSKPQDGGETDANGFANTTLAKLCRYYLACLGYDESGVSAFQESKWELDYVELPCLPATPTELTYNENARKLLQKKNKEQGRFELFLGYPTRVKEIQSNKTGWKGRIVEPILLFPIEAEPDGQLVIDLEFPIINQSAFKDLAKAPKDQVMNELASLEQELGIGIEGERPEIDEIAMRLQAIRHDWPWIDDIAPDASLDASGPLSEIRKSGIYNRCIVILGERSPFTKGLETELRLLARLPQESYANTALGAWIDGRASKVSTEPPQCLIEVLPMNTEQRQAVVTALTNQNTVITGPPGTGKSQVVTNLLINAAWSDKKILFASKNNKAVDVVETRVNALGSRPMLLRVGSKTYQSRLAELVMGMLSTSSTPTEQADYEQAVEAHERMVSELKALIEESRTLVETRNLVDQFEQEAEGARGRLGAELFAKSTDLDLARLGIRVSELKGACDRADKGKSKPIDRLIWPLIKGARLQSLESFMRIHEASFRDIGVILPGGQSRGIDVARVMQAVEEIGNRLEDLKVCSKYLSALKKLSRARSLEEIARLESDIQARIARQSEMMWKLWLRIRPSSISAVERRNLSKYSMVLQMVLDSGEDKLSAEVKKKYKELLREVSHLLPCWAVTSLSARGRIPLEPGLFDIVVFDEASQCDIASALPLLFRAKSVVVIGDKKQLQHISAIPKDKDQALLEKNGLLDDFLDWVYSYQSLFGLAESQVQGGGVVSLVDHHRSHSDIISFANQEFYDESLRVATRYDDLKSPNRQEPGVRWVDVRGAVSRPASGSAFNDVEAKAVVQELRSLVFEKGYVGSIGVVTPFNPQRNLIAELVRHDRDLSVELDRRAFLVETVHKFQGDERDVMLFSPVVSKNTPPGALGFLGANCNLFNVAITRARAQLIVVGDLAECGSSEVGYLSRFARYASSLEEEKLLADREVISELGAIYPAVAKPELVSDWEREFYRLAFNAGISLIPQYPVEKYLVDFLLIHGGRRLVVEIDGERYHRSWTGELCRRDLMRNQRLFELGYDVVRFWVYEVRDRPDECISRLEQWMSRGL